MVVFEPAGSPRFDASPDIKAAANPNPDCVWAEVTMFGNPKLLARNAQTDQDQPGLRVFELLQKDRFILGGEIPVLRDRDRQTREPILQNVGGPLGDSWLSTHKRNCSQSGRSAKLAQYFLSQLNPRAARGRSTVQFQVQHNSCPVRDDQLRLPNDPG